MKVLILATLLVFSDFSRSDCDFTVIPEMVIDAIQAEDGGVIEIEHQNGDGSVSSLFMNNLYLEGWFYVIDEQVGICDVTYALKLGEDGHAVFEYYAKWRG